ncbi:hypothetical protein G6F56_001171 [Rhizopus delemar]|nr:hypothetical protein G6F56_001171 [Rhizopus delemar]
MEIEEVTPLLPPETANALSKPSPWYIIAPIFAISFTFGSIIAPTVEALSIIYCYKYYQSQSTDTPHEQCNIPEIQSTVSQVQAMIMFLSCISALLLAGYYGALSDRKGRRFVMQISMVGGILSHATTLLTLKYYNFFDVYLLFFGPVLRGFLAGEAILIATANAYLSDCTTIANRTLMFGRMIASIYLGTTLGPSFSSFLIKETGTITSVFYMVIGIHVLFLAYVTWIMPESNQLVQKMTDKTTLLERINIFSAFRILYLTRPKSTSRWALPILVLIQMAMMMMLMPPTILYAMLKFGWTSYEGGLFISLGSFTRLLITVVVVPLATHLFRGQRQTLVLDIWLIRIGMATEIVAFVLFGAVSSSFAFKWTVVLQGMAVLASPSVRSVTTSLVDPNELGEFWGVMATVDACSMILSQLVINSIYSASVSTMPQLAFFCLAGIAGIATLLGFCIRTK